ncbi:MAG: translation initiation factor IF-3 [Alphaproteobacteria bacterium]|uniref:Translation initiation factor IF-3 n=1 Tax=Candidatus Nitrobium versatile TaxID=2884831 RepID=A0A953M117_9BACT|nr:translation initiation factor IF-3 [Candidatus Nitrobium versatile]
MFRVRPDSWGGLQYGTCGTGPTNNSIKRRITIANQRRVVPGRVVDTTRINNQIRQIKAKEVRVVADEGQIGIMDIDSALKAAGERDLDLVEISPQADPPVCKIMDYRKFKFEQGKKLRKSKKQQATITLKEIRMRPLIDTHDYDFKKRSVRKFIDQGDKVKVTMRFRGRELSRPELGMNVLNRLAVELEDVAKIESPPKMEGRQMVMILTAL